MDLGRRLGARRGLAGPVRRGSRLARPLGLASSLRSARSLGLALSLGLARPLGLASSLRRARPLRRALPLGLALSLGLALALSAGAAAQSTAEAVGAQGRSADAGATVLTLREALGRAAEHNPRYRQALNRIELEETQRQEAWGAFLPNLSVSFGTSQGFRRQATAEDFFGNTIENEDTRIATNSSSSQGARLGFDLFRGGERFHSVDRVRAQAQADRLGAEDELNRILAEVHRQYLAAQRQKARLAVEEQLFASRERDYQLAERRFELAAIGQSDLLAASLDRERQRVSVGQARSEVDKAMLALRRAIGDPSLDVLDVGEELAEPFDPEGMDIEAIVASAMRSSPAVGVAEANRAVAQSQLGAANASRWPTLSVSSSFSRTAYAPERAALFDFAPQDWAASLGLNVSIPLFTRFQTTQRIASASVELRNAGEQVRDRTMELEMQVNSRYVDLRAAWENVQLQETVLEVAGARLRFVNEEYRLATRGIEDLRTAVREEATARRDLVDQRFAFQEALVGLYESAGLVAAEAGLGRDGD